MAAVDHWHPVARSEDLTDRPLGVNVAGREVVLFRASDGALGALTDRCPHRGMRLSTGSVDGDRLVCPYHGWRWAADGHGTAPGTPTAKPCAERFDVVERLGAVWVKSSGSSPAFPRWDVEGWTPVGRLVRRVKVPLELALDNFIEVEHTPTTHTFLGHPIERMAEVECVTTVSDDRVRVYNKGPQKPLPWVIRRLFRVPDGAHFVDDWTTFFSPVFTVYDQYWVDPATDQPAPEALRVAVFFNPVSDRETELFVFTHARSPVWSRYGLDLALRPLTLGLVALEVRRDATMLSRLADHDTALKGRALGRFDKALVAARARVDRIYRGA